MVNNLGVQNKNNDFAAKYKQAFFVDWRICDRMKINLLPEIDYLLDTNIADNPKMLTGNALREGLKQVARKPFRVVPFFDPGPWGGQWMKEVFDLDQEVENFAWCFDCVPEENSVLLTYGDIIVEVPSLNLIFYQPKEVLGNEVYEILGPEFPIRFDLLDTMDGGNLSLQVHPLADYIREHFGLTYTQDESYYMLDAKNDAFVYLGLKENINPSQMIEELKAAQNGGEFFDADKHVQKWDVKKHDHILIPAGTVHCSGKDSMVLEISATPYIFTFKLWDWGRLGLDGKPRPIYIDHGQNVIKWDRTEAWTRKNLINTVKVVDENNHFREEVTGLHKLQFIETRRHWFTGAVLHDTQGTFNVLNLVEGREVIVESPDGLFEPLIIHYAETFVVPSSVGEYTIRPYGESESKECATIKAFVRTDKLRSLGEDLRMM
jgi:mannose-6-phosphate isomerase class I